MKRRDLIKSAAAIVPGWLMSKAYAGTAEILDNNFVLPESEGPFTPDWASLAQYKVPDWFQDAKFGIWAHWGVQCQPEHGDWYARGMYEEGSRHYKFHCQKYGHPSQFGFKDVIQEWKADKWDADSLVGLYKSAGAKYFVAMANHHDNFDNYNSSYQAWNSVNLGPKKDIIAGWAAAAKKHALNFGVSVHAAHAWTWYEPSQKSDLSGPFKGMQYDGKLARLAGKGKWWEGYDPQELYAQGHPLSAESDKSGSIHQQWNWGNGASVPDKDYCGKFFKRTVELLDKYHPDLLYFDDTALPLWPISDVGLQIAAHMYNGSIARNGGKLQAVINGKILDEQQRKCMVWDIERGASNSIEQFVWQTDTCIGGWHYDRSLYERNGYKSASNVIQILVDVVSKNGNLLLNIPVRGDGSIDEKETAIVQEIGRWMNVNSEAIYGTRPWKIFGEGPAIASAAPLSAQGFNEGKNRPFGADDIRFTIKGNAIYATFFGWPSTGRVEIKSLRHDSPHLAGARINRVGLLGGSDSLAWSQGQEGLSVSLPPRQPCDHAFVLKVAI